MSADSFLQGVTQALFVVIFLVVLVRAARRRYRANVDAGLFFGATAVIIVASWISSRVGTPALLTLLLTTVLMALPYLLLRLIDDYAGVPPRLMRAAEVGLAVSIVLLAIFTNRTIPGIVVALLVAYFVAITAYIVYVVARAARFSSGVTRRRMRAVALGTACLGLSVLGDGLSDIPHVPIWALRVASDVLGFGCVLGFVIGFVPPRWLLRAWQEPELRAFLGRAASLPRLETTGEIVRQLERGASRSVGTGMAVIGLWDSEVEGLVDQGDEDGGSRPLADPIARESFAAQAPVFCADVAKERPEDAPQYAARGANSVLAVPITAGSNRLGVLSLYATRAPIFAEDDLALAHLLADQAAVILESRVLIDEAARVQAREEATRLKDDFLSAAAHDLKTPLTAIIAQAQLMERRARRDPDRPADLTGIQRIARDGERLRRLVTELLDVGRVEQGKLLGRRETVDLTDLAQGVSEHVASPQHQIRIRADGPVVGDFDPVRIAQLLDNLLENAVKYSPEGGPIDVRITREGAMAAITVTDRGIGVPPEDLDTLFERFHRGTNVDDRRFAGMGLGLFICRGIAEQHGGRLWATSAGREKGSTFHVELPLAAPDSSPVSPAYAPGVLTHAEGA